MQSSVTNSGSAWVKRFAPLWAAQAFSLLGSGLVQFALVWWLTQTTGSASVLAAATGIAMLPEVLLGPFAGALVDRWNRKLVMIIADGAVAGATLVLALLFWAGSAQIWHIYVLMFCRALGGVFHWAALQASTSLMVPDEHLARVAGVNQSLRGALNIATPPFAALLLTLIPLHNILWIDVSTAAVAIGMTLIVRIPQPAAAPSSALSLNSVLKDVGAGLRYVRAWPGMLTLLLMATLLNFIAFPSFTLMPLLVTGHFQGGAWHLSAMESLWGLGIVAGGLLLGVWGGFRKKIYTMMLGLIVQGLAFTLVAAAHPDQFTLALVGMGITGMMNALVNGPIFALLQSRVAPEMQGRVFTLVGSLAGAMSPLSMVIAGPTADAFGVRPWYWITAVFTFAIGASAFLVPSIRHLEDDTNGQPAPDANLSMMQESSD